MEIQGRFNVSNTGRLKVLLVPKAKVTLHLEEIYAI
jgi:hypothetical protein